MSSTHIIDGKARAAAVRADIARDIAALRAAGGPTPGLVLIQVGDNATSAGHIARKHRQAEAAGIAVHDIRLPAETGQVELLSLIARLNHDPAVHAILVQLPLPAGFDADTVLTAIHPDKDVDGLHPENLGRLAGGTAGLVPCTPLGCLHLIQSVQPAWPGLRAVVLGRSRLVGMPMALLLVNAGASVTVLHSASTDEPAICRDADILVSAVGKPGLVRGDWVKPGAIVIDVGQSEQGGAWVGDVAFDEVAPVAGAITPVPGGVGPMTIAMLLSNTLTACRRQIVR